MTSGNDEFVEVEWDEKVEDNPHELAERHPDSVASKRQVYPLTPSSSSSDGTGPASLVGRGSAGDHGANGVRSASGSMSNSDSDEAIVMRSAKQGLLKTRHVSEGDAEAVAARKKTVSFSCTPLERSRKIVNGEEML